VKIEIKGPMLKPVESKSDTLFVYGGRLYAKTSYSNVRKEFDVVDMYGSCAAIPFGTQVSFIKSVSVEVE